MSEPFEPKIVAFVCTYCTYAGADLAGTSRLNYAPNVRIVRLPCTGRISPMFILKALQKGADSVLVSGCHPGDCHFTAGNYHARRRWTVFRALLSFTGIPEERIRFSWISAAEGPSSPNSSTKSLTTPASSGRSRSTRSCRKSSKPSRRINQWEYRNNTEVKRQRCSRRAK